MSKWDKVFDWCYKWQLPVGLLLLVLALIPPVSPYNAVVAAINVGMALGRITK